MWEGTFSDVATHVPLQQLYSWPEQAPFLLRSIQEAGLYYRAKEPEILHQRSHGVKLEDVDYTTILLVTFWLMKTAIVATDRCSYCKRFHHENMPI